MHTYKLRDICRLKQWKALSKRFFTQSGYPVYGANGIIGHYSHYNHESPVIAISCRGDSCGQINYTAPYSYVTGNALCVEDVREDVLPLYLYYYLNQADFSPYITGAAQPQLTKSILGNMPIPVCSMQKQQHIVGCMQKIEKILQLRRQQLSVLLKLKSDYYAQTFHHLENCDLAPLEKVASILTGKHNSNAAVANGRYPFFTCAHTPKRIDSYSFDGQCVLLTGNIDFQVTYFEGQFDAYQRTYVISPRNSQQLCTPYLYAFMEHYLPQLQQQALGGVIKYIRRPMLCDIEVPIPPLSRQQAIGDFALRLLHMQNAINQAICHETKWHQQQLSRFFAAPFA